MQLNWIKIARYGATGGVCFMYLCLVGMVETFDTRDVIEDVLSLGWALIITVAFGLGYVSAKKLSGGKAVPAIISSLLAGLLGGAILALMVALIEPLNLRQMFVNASPGLVEMLTFDQESMLVGLLMLVGLITITSIVGGAVDLLPPLLRKMTFSGLAGVLIMGMLGELLDIILSRGATKAIANYIFGKKGLSVEGAIIVFILFAVVAWLWITQKNTVQAKKQALPNKQQRWLSWIIMAVSIIFIILLPQAVGPYISQILVLVGLYALMGLGLNIEIGLAGLLDLGFVGFFAIGAYTVAILTSTTELGLSSVMAGELVAESYTSFWVAIPIAVAVAGLAGVFLGIPVLRMRGDYLAIVTLGFAEIIRILVLSNFLQPLLGGAQGILNIPKPELFLGTLAAIIPTLPGYLQTVAYMFASEEGLIKDPAHFFYLILIGCVIVAFIAWRLQNARVGRNWMAMREDEDVAEAMGINLIFSKLLAFGIGAAFAGLAGAIFAAQVGSVFPHSFGLIVSINVVSLVIIGGSGSIPGVIVGSLVLVGLPELLREFSEFRLLIYGALLVVMMLVKPEGLWPSEVRKREFHADEDEPIDVDVDSTPAAQAA